MKRHCFTSYPLLALIGLILSPLAVAHASPSFDWEQWLREHPRPAGKAVQDRNRGEPRTVRMIYFLPNDRPYRQDVVDEMKVLMRRVQTFFAEQRQAHGHGNTTFRFETDVQGAPLVHRVDGQHPAKHYDNHTMGEVLDEIYWGEGPLQFDVLANDYLIVIELNVNSSIDAGGVAAAGVNTDLGKRGGITLVGSNPLNLPAFGTVAHELGHTFGLGHDFRDDAYIMSYGSNSDRLSACAAEFLSVHPYFNADISVGGKPDIHRAGGGILGTSQGNIGNPATFKTISPLDYPVGSTKVSFRLKVSDMEGLHQVQLSDNNRENSGGAAGLEGLAACRGLNGEQDAIVEFEYDVSIPPYGWDPSVPESHALFVRVVDSDGEATFDMYSLVEASSYKIATLDHENTTDISSVSFSPDGTLLATTGDHLTQLWDVSSRQVVATIQHERWSTGLSFSPDGTLLAIGAVDGVLLWDVASRERVAVLQTAAGYAAGDWIFGTPSFSPDGTLLAISADLFPLVRLWDVASRQLVAPLQDEEGVNSPLFSPDGALLAATRWKEGSGSTVSLWDVASREKSWEIEGSAGDLFSFSPDGTLLAITGDHLTQLWDVASRQVVATIQSEGWSTGLSFSPDGTLLAIRKFDGGLVQLWDVASRQLVTTFGHTGFVEDMSFSSDGILAVGGDDGTVSLWDVSEWIGEQAVISVGEQDSDGEIADDESSGEDQPESGGQPAIAVELESISASHDSVRENDGQATTITLTVTLKKTAATDETITLALVSPLVGKTAKRGEDFDAILAETLTIAKGQRTGTAQLTLTPKDNTTAEGDKAFAVQATSSSGHAALVNIKIIDNDTATEPQARLTPDPAEVAFSADDPAWKTFTVHTNLDSVLVRANPSGSDPALEVAGGQQVPTRDYCPAEGNDRPTRGRRDGWSLHVKACQAGQTKILLIDYDTGEVVQEYEVNVEASTSAAVTTVLNPSYPNPFNSETVLSYTLPTTSDIRLEVFTLSGQRVAVLHEGFQAAGYHTLSLDAADLASGVYLYRLTTPEGRFVQKFTLLR